MSQGSSWMPTNQTQIPWWLNESLDVVHRCFSRDWALLTECQRERFEQELAETVVRECAWVKSASNEAVAHMREFANDILTHDPSKPVRLAACKAAREIFGRIL